MNGSLSPSADVRNLSEILGLSLVLLVLALFAISQSGIRVVPNSALIATSNEKPSLTAPAATVAAISGQDTVWPACGIVTAEFGVPHSPWQASHTGIDIANPSGRTGAAITPFRQGTVIVVDSSVSTGWGKHVIVGHDGDVTSLYGHMSGVNVVQGQRVAPGSTLGWEGSTGNSTGPHVHFEVRQHGTPVDPRNFVTGNPSC